jgi:hypothetical protein
MQIHYIDGLLQASMTICYRGLSMTIDNLVIDTWCSSLPLIF